MQQQPGLLPVALHRPLRHTPECGDVREGEAAEVLQIDDLSQPRLQRGELLDRLRAAQRRYERPTHLGPLEITLTPPLRSTEQAAYADLGADRLVMVPSNSLDRDGLCRWLEERAPR